MQLVEDGVLVPVGCATRDGHASSHTTAVSTGATCRCYHRTADGEDAPLEEAALGRVGSTLRGKYLLERVLGVGGMAAVYRATNTKVRRACAVKVVHRDLSAMSEVRSRFLREGRAANAVGHRGAVDVLDSDVAEDGSAFLVMELLEGQSVEELWLFGECRAVRFQGAAGEDAGDDESANEGRRGRAEL